MPQLCLKLMPVNEYEALTVFQAKAKMVSLRGELSALFERRMEEKEAKINQLTEELNGVRQKVRFQVYTNTHVFLCMKFKDMVSCYMSPFLK